MCSDGWFLPKEMIDGECEDCGMETVDGYARYGCHYASVICETCGDAPCDGGC